MTFDKFKTMILAFAKANGVSVSRVFIGDKNKYIAKCADGVTISGSHSNGHLTVKTHNHMYYIPVASVAGILG